MTFTLTATTTISDPQRSLSVQFTDNDNPQLTQVNVFEVSGCTSATPTALVPALGHAVCARVSVAAQGGSSDATFFFQWIDANGTIARAEDVTGETGDVVTDVLPGTSVTTGGVWTVRTCRGNASKAIACTAVANTITRLPSPPGGNSVPRQFTVPAVASTTSITASPANAQTFGQEITFTAEVRRTSDNSLIGTGTVRFYDGGNSCSDLTGASQIGVDRPVTAGQAEVKTSSLSVSPPTHTIRACYIANSTFNASQASLSYTVNPAQAATTLAVEEASGSFGRGADLKATLVAGSSPVEGKTISFKLNGTEACGVAPIPACPQTNSSGVAELNGASLNGIDVGTYTTGVSANFAGDATHVAANGSAKLTVNQADQTINFPAVGPFTFGAQSTFQVAATASSNLTVSFATQTANKCTISGTTVTIVEAGTCTIRASQAGNNNYKAAPNVDQDITINKADQTITFAALADKTFGDAAFHVSATASSNLAVTFALGAGSVGCSISGNTVSITGATGTGEFCIIVAKQAGNVNYNPAPDVSRSFTIAKAATATAVQTSKTPSVYGEPVTFTATVSATPSGLSGTVTFKDGTTEIGTGALSCAATCTAHYTTGAEQLGVGARSITAAYGGNANFESSTSPAITQDVNAAPTTTALGSASYTATYGDANVALSATVTANDPSQAIVRKGPLGSL